MPYSNRDEIDLTAPVVREFRVKCVRRYIVTDWDDYRGGGRVRELGEYPNTQAANMVAKAFGTVYPGSLVNCMDEPDDSIPLPLVLDTEQALLTMPWPLAATIRRDARYRNDADMLATLDRLGVAVDA